MRSRLEAFRGLIASRKAGTRSLSDGWEFIFADDARITGQLEDFARIERQCCGFLEWRVRADEEGVVLEVRGDAAGRDWLVAQLPELAV